FQGLAGYRLARLAGRGTADEKAAVERCLAHAEPSEQHVLYAAEMAVLRAACLALARQSETLKASWHERRLPQALARARSDDAANPRVALIEGQLALARMDFAAAATHLGNAVKFFATELDHGRELWGHAEALAILAYLHLRQGESRQARDLAE